VRSITTIPGRATGRCRLEEGKLLGGINRVRGAVYDVVSTLRHEKNGTPRREPTEHDATPAT
jgi:hypothetical protein